MFRCFKTKAGVPPSDQHDLSSKIFPHERYGASPLFPQELEEGVLGHGVLCVFEGALQFWGSLYPSRKVG